MNLKLRCDITQGLRIDRRTWEEKQVAKDLIPELVLSRLNMKKGPWSKLRVTYVAESTEAGVNRKIKG